MRPLLALSLAVVLGLPPRMAQASDAEDLFRQALRLDLKGGADDASLAFGLYRRAAEAGLPDAQFNVAVMLDSGRGVAADVGEAANWYARAAAHGNARAAFNLGQLYEAGEGVPANLDLARAWFSASALPAARARAAGFAARPAPAGSALTAPTLHAAGHQGRIDRDARSIELVWTSPAQPEPTRFFVELRSSTSTGSQEVYSAFMDLSSVNVALTAVAEAYAWRVLAVSSKEGRYVASSWSYFRASPPVMQ